MPAGVVCVVHTRRALACNSINYYGRHDMSAGYTLSQLCKSKILPILLSVRINIPRLVLEEAAWSTSNGYIARGKKTGDGIYSPDKCRLWAVRTCVHELGAFASKDLPFPNVLFGLDNFDSQEGSLSIMFICTCSAYANCASCAAYAWSILLQFRQAPWDPFGRKLHRRHRIGRWRRRVEVVAQGPHDVGQIKSSSLVRVPAR